MKPYSNETPKILLQETEKLLEKWKHPDPYRPPYAPGGEHKMSLCGARNAITDTDPGTKYERNLPPPNLDRMLQL